MHTIVVFKESQNSSYVPAWEAAAEATMMSETCKARRQSRPRCTRLCNRNLYLIVHPGMKYKYATRYVIINMQATSYVRN